jgi:hypothetical protein
MPDVPEQVVGSITVAQGKSSVGINDLDSV